METSAPRPRALTFLYLTVVLDVLAFGIVVPVMPSLVQQFLQGDTVRAAHMWGLFGSAFAVAQFLCSPILGALSDRFGRRPILLLALFGLGVDYVIMAAAPTLAWLWVGRITSGICGATYSTAGAYIADVTPPEKRAGAFGMIGAAWGIGFVLGPAMGGALGAVNPRLPFWVAAALTLANAAYGFASLPESLPVERRKPFAWARANPVGALVLLRSHVELSGLAFVHACYQLAHQVLGSTYVLYVTHRYAWTPATTGAVLALVGVTSAVVQGGLIRPAVRRLGERRALLTGLGTAALSSLAYGLARTGSRFLIGIPFGSLGGLYSPSAQSLMSQRVAPEAQGQLQGAMASLQGLAGLVGPVLFSSTFAWAIGPERADPMPGAPFVLAGAIQLMGLGAAVWVTGAAARRETGAAP